MARWNAAVTLRNSPDPSSSGSLDGSGFAIGAASGFGSGFEMTSCAGALGSSIWTGSGSGFGASTGSLALFSSSTGFFAACLALRLPDRLPNERGAVDALRDGVAAGGASSLASSSAGFSDVAPETGNRHADSAVGGIWNLLRNYC